MNTVLDMETRESFGRLDVLNIGEPFDDVIGFTVVTEISLGVGNRTGCGLAVLFSAVPSKHGRLHV